MRMALLFLLAALGLAGCGQDKMVYLTADGRLPGSDPALTRQFQLDHALCNDEMARSVQGGDHGDGSATRGNEVEGVGEECMAEKGYVYVRQDQVAATQQQLAHAAAPPLAVPAPARN